VLLHNGNIHPSKLIAHSVHMKENLQKYEFALESYKLLNIWMGNTRGSQKIRFPILLPPNNFT
jgi:hypothetical protein